MQCPSDCPGTRTANKAKTYIFIFALTWRNARHIFQFRKLVAETSEKIEHVHAEIERLSQMRRYEIPASDF